MRVLGIVVGSLLYAAALPPFDHAWCAWGALVPLMIAVRGATLRSAFAYGCLFGYASGWSVLWMLAETGVRYFQLPWALSVFGAGAWFLVVVGLPFAVFAIASAIILRRFAFRESAAIVPALWVTCEMLRGKVFGQPWGLLGYTQHEHAALIQIAAATGVYGVSYLVALGNVALAEVLVRHRDRPRISLRLAPALAPFLVIALCWIGGAAALSVGGDAADGAAPRRVAIVQTNVAPARTWTPAYTAAQIAAHIRATESLSSAQPSALIVWPEYSVPRYLEQDATVAGLVRMLAQKTGADLLLGSPRYEDGRSYNSVRLIRADGLPGGHYDKRRLVLFAEQSPLEWATSSSSRFAVGADPNVLVGFARLGVSICHEALHPDLIADSVRSGAELLVNVANDSWVGGESSAAARQHLAMATLRAVETRRFLVRAALTGVSAIVDPFGRVTESLPAGTAGVLTGAVVPRSGLTWYVRMGDLFGWSCVVGCAMALTVARWHRRAAIGLPVGSPALA